MSTTLKQKLMKEIEGFPDDLPEEAQQKILRTVHALKKSVLLKKRLRKKPVNALVAVDEFAIETGIPDLSSQHDHYLYGTPKK